MYAALAILPVHIGGLSRFTSCHSSLVFPGYSSLSLLVLSNYHPTYLYHPLTPPSFFAWSYIHTLCVTLSLSLSISCY